MKNAEFRPKLNPADKPFEFPSKSGRSFMLKDCFKPQVTIAIGSFIQAALCAILPFRWAIVPSAAVLLNSIITTLIQVRSTKPSDHHTWPGNRTTSVLFRDIRLQARSEFCCGLPSRLSDKPPLGLAAPGMKEIGENFTAILKDLESNRDEYGLLTSSSWRGDERNSNNTLLNIYYFRDMEGLQRFAHGDIHRKVWDYMNKTKPKHIGIFHETYSVPARAYENIYVNCHPVLMGRASVRTTPAGEEDERWTNTLVSADVPAMKTQYARMSRDEQGSLKET
ncbi:Monooxygenase af470 [Fusarium culmorum]|uniref:Monooxygenase af470 n=1 Tax=Fusarium culmorum TaxID=5516 RepID=A0A2T4H2W9_FUSCU|nr:Monooxygenase af470 [Fusarium culmorum]